MRALQEAPLDYAGAARPISLGSVAIQELAPAERIRNSFLVLPAKDGGTKGLLSRPGLDWRFACRRGAGPPCPSSLFVPVPLLALEIPLGRYRRHLFRQHLRSEERRVGNDCVSLCRSWW